MGSNLLDLDLASLLDVDRERVLSSIRHCDPDSICVNHLLMGRTTEKPLYEQIQEFKPSRGDHRRKLIIDAVIDIIAKDGIHALTAFSVGKRTKMRRSHITYYFPNQAGMVEAAVKQVVSTGQEITVEFLAKASTPRTCLKSYVAATFEWFKRNPKHMPVMTLLQYYGTVSPAYRKLNTQIRSAGENRIGEMLKSGTAKNNPAQIKKTARLIREILVGSLTTFFFSEKNPSFEIERKRIEKIILDLASEVWES